MTCLVLHNLIFLWCTFHQASTANNENDDGEKPAVLVLYSSAGYHPLNGTIELIQQSNLNLLFFDLKSPNCEEEVTTAVSTFIQVVFEEGANVISTIGPSCTDSAYAISMLTSRKEVSMMHFHVSPMPTAKMDLSFGLMSTADIYADVCLALNQMHYYDWFDVIALYQDTNRVMNLVFLRLQKLLSESSNVALKLNASSLQRS